jgi:hypothetical protein
MKNRLTSEQFLVYFDNDSNENEIFVQNSYISGETLRRFCSFLKDDVSIIFEECTLESVIIVAGETTQTYIDDGSEDG